MKQILLLSLLLALLLAGCAPAASSVPSGSFDPAKLGTIERDVTYCSADGVDLKMDVYYPDSGGPWPVVVMVHGGGWTDGDKKEMDGGLAGAGYLVVSLNYRMYPDAQFPAMIQDVKCAIRSLRAHAGQYNLDPDHIGLLGGSAGGHLVALAGLADESAGWDVGEYTDQSSRVQAVVDLAGPADLTREFPQQWVVDLLDGVFGADQLVSGSPVTYASPDDPPFFILHGDADPIVPVEQAQILYDALQQAGIPVEMVIVHNGGHGLEPVSGTPEPPADEAFGQVFQFFERILKGGE